MKERKLYKIGDAFKALNEFLETPLEVDYKPIQTPIKGFVTQTLEDFLYNHIDPSNLDDLVVIDIKDEDEDIIVYRGNYRGLPEHLKELSFHSFSAGEDEIIFNVGLDGFGDSHINLKDVLKDYVGNDIIIYNLELDDIVFKGDKNDLPENLLDAGFISFSVPSLLVVNINKEKTIEENYVYSPQELLDAVIASYGFTKKEAKDYIKTLSDESKELLVKGFKQDAKKAFYEKKELDEYHGFESDGNNYFPEEEMKARYPEEVEDPDTIWVYQFPPLAHEGALERIDYIGLEEITNMKGRNLSDGIVFKGIRAQLEEFCDYINYDMHPDYLIPIEKFKYRWINEELKEYYNDNIKFTIPLRDKKDAKIIEGLIGQLSDGMWENSPWMEKYWTTIDIEGTNLIIKKRSNFRTSLFNPFTNEPQAKKWLAGKLKAVIKDEFPHKDSWSKTNKDITGYISYNNDITVADVYSLYDWLLDRKERVIKEGAEGHRDPNYEFIIYELEEPYKIINKRSTYAEAEYLVNRLRKKYIDKEYSFEHVEKGRHKVGDVFESQQLNEVKFETCEIVVKYPNKDGDGDIMVMKTPSGEYYNYYGVKGTGLVGPFLSKEEAIEAVRKHRPFVFEAQDGTNEDNISKVNKGFKSIETLVEGERFDIKDKEDIIKAKEFIKKKEPVEIIVDVNAETISDLNKKGYVGSLILQCPICKTLFYLEPEELEKMEGEDDLYTSSNPDSELHIDNGCPHCNSKDEGYKIIGQVGEFVEEEKEIEVPEEEIEINIEDKAEEIPELKAEEEELDESKQLKEDIDNFDELVAEAYQHLKVKLLEDEVLKLEDISAELIEHYTAFNHLSYLLDSPKHVKEWEDFMLKVSSSLSKQNLKFVDDVFEQLSEDKLFAYNPELWEPEDIELHKSIDWGARNYEKYRLDDFIIHKAYIVGRDEEPKEIKFYKTLRPNPIYPPYYKAEEIPFENTTGGMFNGEKHGKYNIHNRFETWRAYKYLSEDIDHLDKDNFNYLINDYLAEVYKDDRKYELLEGFINTDNKTIKLKGIVEKQDNTEEELEFIFEYKTLNKGSIKLTSLNEFKLKLLGKIKDKNLIVEILNYTHVLNESQTLKNSIIRRKQ